MEEFIIKAASGDYVGDGDTFNSQRSYAKRFASREEAQAAADQMPVFVEVEVIPIQKLAPLAAV